MKSAVSIPLTAFFIAIFACAVEAKSWRGIVPLRSTRVDVERVLGQPSEASEKFVTYRLESEIVVISLITKDTPAANLKLLRSGTVQDIQVVPKNSLYFSDLGLDEKRIVFIKGSRPEYSGFYGYVDQDAGLIVKAGR